ncbi:lysozyme family protein [Paenibacillus aestuarii]|uniref:Lysozyme family protein n=1 Tax=Paenibacillus aestuarii TaxID=516965 RepID=A0ABW0KGG1_9BACL
MDAQDISKQAADDAGNVAKKTGSAALKKVAGAVGKHLKKLMMKFIKQLIVSLFKAIIAYFGPIGIVVFIVIMLFLAVLSAIPFSDWFLDGNARSDAQKNADSRYEQEFRRAADSTVAEIQAIEADQSWKIDLMNTIKPSWGIPSALVRYEILEKNKKVKLSDYNPSDLIKSFAPQYSYKTISDDKQWTKNHVSCTYTYTTTYTDEDGVEHERTRTRTETHETISESYRPPHKVLSKVSFDYGSMDINSLKKYYPGGTLTDSGEWSYSGTSSSGDCTTTSYKKYENTTVDDRYVPPLNINGPQFQNTLVGLGVDKTDMKLFYEFIVTADRSWNPTMYGGKSTGGGGLFPGDAQVSVLVSRYEPIVRKYAELNGIPDLVGILLALIQQETGGRYLDVMQSSESLGLPPNTLTDPELSIQVGVKYFAGVYRSAGNDINLALQSYNFGGGFISYANQHGGYSIEVAQAFSSMMAAKNGWSSYGDPFYVDHVMRYYNATVITVGGEGQIFDVKKALDIMSNFLGLPYVWGGRSPSAGGFDCSGLIEYAFDQLDIDLSGNAETQYDKTVAINPSEAKPGDLVFWSTYKSAASHVGMYLGNDKFINANNGKGVSYSSVEGWSNLYKFLGYRRIVK